eukprot:SAG31_NODE_18672_length_627_cov_0.848485_1_plen_102_part_10
MRRKADKPRVHTRNSPREAPSNFTFTKASRATGLRKGCWQVFCDREASMQMATFNDLQATLQGGGESNATEHSAAADALCKHARTFASSASSRAIHNITWCT